MWKRFIKSQYESLFSDEIETRKKDIESLNSRIKALVSGLKKIDKPKVSKKITIFEVNDLLKKSFPNAQVFLSDKEYAVTSVSEAERFLKYDLTNVQKFEKEILDCDDFSRSLWTYWRDWQSDLAIGILWITKPYAHALNVAILESNEEIGVYVVEPQQDRIYKVPKDYVSKLIVM